MRAELDGMMYDGLPSILVLADSEAGLTGAAMTAGSAGARISAALPLDQALDRLTEQSAIGLVVADLTGDHGEVLDLLIDRLDQAAALGRHNSVVSFPDALIDVVAARSVHRGVTLLCSGDEAQRGAAIRAALTDPSRARVNEEGDGSPERLQQLSEEVNRIARTLAALSGKQAQAQAPREVALADLNSGGRAVMANAIRGLIRARRLRDQYFDPLLFADPAWDMLLDLTAARLEGRQVAVSSLCIAAAVPPTTALRWIKSLTEEGLFLRVADPNDGRRVFIALSDAAADGMTGYFRALERAGLGPRA